MLRCMVLILAFCLVPTQTRAAESTPGAQAAKLRAQGDLIPYSPPAKFLEAYFTADEAQPKNVWGPVSAFAASRRCKTAWLIERPELARVERLAAAKDAPPFEFSLILEEDCQGRVTHAVFVTAPGASAEDWFKWRRQFHGGKAQGYYGDAEAGLKRAAAAHKPPTAELRFLSLDGELLLGSPEQALEAEGRLKPVFSLQPAK